MLLGVRHRAWSDAWGEVLIDLSVFKEHGGAFGFQFGNEGLFLVGARTRDAALTTV